MLRSLLRRRSAKWEDLESRLVWIFGSPRSGSTWLHDMLAEHDAVIAINEPLIGWFLGPIMSDLPGVDPEGLDVETFTLRGLQRRKRSQFFSDEFKEVWLPRLRELVGDRLFAEVSRKPQADRDDYVVAVKEPNGSQSADVILDALPRSRLLFLLRDGRDVVDSELAASRKGSWVTREGRGAYRGVSDAERLRFIVNSAHKWLWRTEVVAAAFARHQGAKYMLRYEDLLDDPVDELRRTFDWLGLEISDQDLSSVVHRHSFEQLPDEATGPLKFHRAAKPGLWRENLTEEERSTMSRILEPKLRELGYET